MKGYTPPPRLSLSNEPQPITRSITITEGISVKDLAEKLGLRAKDLIARLDVPLPLGTGRIHVYYLKYANAFELIPVIGSLVGGGGGGFGGFGAAQGPRPRVVMQFPQNPDDMLLSGTLAGGQALAGKRVLVASHGTFLQQIHGVITGQDGVEAQGYVCAQTGRPPGPSARAEQRGAPGKS